MSRTEASGDHDHGQRQKEEGRQERHQKEGRQEGRQKEGQEVTLTQNWVQFALYPVFTNTLAFWLRWTIVPHSQLESATLRALVVEFVTRAGTDHSIVIARVYKDLAQLALHQFELYFDVALKGCNIAV